MDDWDNVYKILKYNKYSIQVFLGDFISNCISLCQDKPSLATAFPNSVPSPLFYKTLHFEHTFKIIDSIQQNMCSTATRKENFK